MAFEFITKLLLKNDDGCTALYIMLYSKYYLRCMPYSKNVLKNITCNISKYFIVRNIRQGGDERTLNHYGDEQYSKEQSINSI